MTQVDLNTLIHDIKAQLSSHYTSPQQALWVAWHLLSWVTSIPQAHMLTHKIVTLTQKQQQLLEQALHNIIKQHMPVAYILGTVPFLDLTLKIEPPILIPRPETEEWCSWLIQKLQQLPQQQQTITVLDLCTGSGCIALALGKALPHAIIYAVDISAHACALAQYNADTNMLHNVHILQSNLYENIPQDIMFDLIVANPPYISYQEWCHLEPSVRIWEDPQALIAEDQGFAYIKTISTGARNKLRCRADFQAYAIPQLIIEIGATQAEQSKNIVHNARFYAIASKKDLAGHDRIIYAGLPPCGLSPHLITIS